jgi:hypothetical protein
MQAANKYKNVLFESCSRELFAAYPRLLFISQKRTICSALSEYQESLNLNSYKRKPLKLNQNKTTKQNRKRSLLRCPTTMKTQVLVQAKMKAKAKAKAAELLAGLTPNMRKLLRRK